jgi:vacuolar protein sorting-associated protein 53
VNQSNLSHSSRQLASLIPGYRQQPVRNLDEDEFSSQAVIPSSTEIFHFYRLAMNQCAKLSTGSRLLELSKTFAKYLDIYCQQVLLHVLVEIPGPQGPSIEDTIVILNTADYCYLTCNQLEEKIRSKIDEDIRGEVDLQNQADAFMSVSSIAIRILVKKVEGSLDHVWKEMRNFPWSKMESVVDQSSYVPEMLRLIEDTSTEILKYLHKPQYSRSFCDNLVDGISMAYCANVLLCKPVSEVGAEQMLLDSYALKKGLLQIPVQGAEPGTQPPAA